MTASEPARLEQPVPMFMAPVPQKWTVVEGELNDQRVVVLTVMSPMATMLLTLDEASALALVDSLRSKFSGLTVATHIPGQNGSRPTGGP